VLVWNASTAYSSIVRPTPTMAKKIARELLLRLGVNVATALLITESVSPHFINQSSLFQTETSIVHRENTGKIIKAIKVVKRKAKNKT